MKPCLLSLPVLLAVGALTFAARSPAADTTYYQNVAPIVKRSCAGCHSGESPKGHLSMESLDTLLEGGKKGPPVVPGKPAESLLYLLASREKKPSMPPKVEDALGAEDIAVLRAWIEGGARPGEAPVEEAPYSRPLVPPVYQRPCVIPALAYSADGTRLFVAGYHEVLVHDPEPADAHSSAPAARWVGEAERLNALAVSPDGKLLAAAGGSPALFGELQLWSVEAGKLERFLRVGRDTFFAVAFSPDGKRLALGGADRVVRVVEVGGLKAVYGAEVHSDWVFGVAYTSDGSRLLTGGRDKTVKAVEAADGKFAGNLVTLNDPIFVVRARPGTPQVLGAGEGREPLLLDSKELKEVRKYEGQPGPVLAAAFSPDGKLLAVGGASPEVRVYQAEDGARKLTLRPGSEWTYAICFRPDGERVAVAGYDGTVRIFGLKDEKELRSFVPVPVAGPSAPPAQAGGAGAR